MVGMNICFEKLINDFESIEEGIKDKKNLIEEVKIFIKKYIV